MSPHGPSAEKAFQTVSFSELMVIVLRGASVKMFMLCKPYTGAPSSSFWWKTCSDVRNDMTRLTNSD